MLRAKQEGDVCRTGKGPWKTHKRKTGMSRNVHTPARSICCTGNFNSVIISEINMMVHSCQAPGVYVGRALLARSRQSPSFLLLILSGFGSGSKQWDMAVCRFLELRSCLIVKINEDWVIAAVSPKCTLSHKRARVETLEVCGISPQQAVRLQVTTLPSPHLLSIWR